MYNLPDNYTPRLDPAYFDDVLPDSALWQADVYKLGAILAHKVGVHHLIDLGCGNGEKLKPYADTFNVLGVDFGRNADNFYRNLRGQYLVTDLNTTILMPAFFQDSVVICADMIEHLPSPDALINTLHNACAMASYVLLSTPDRERVYKGEHIGPPGNPYHCREWTNRELVGWLQAEGFPIQWHGWTISNQNRPDQIWTSLVVLSKYNLVLNLPSQYEPAYASWDKWE